MMKTILISLGIVLFFLTAHMLFPNGVVYAIENNWVILGIYAFVYFFTFRTFALSVHAWIHYPQLRTRWDFWGQCMMHILAAFVALVFFVEILWLKHGWSWLMFIPLIGLGAFFQMKVYGDIRNMIQEAENPEQKGEIWKHPEKHPVQIFLKWVGVFAILGFIVWKLWERLWEVEATHIIFGGIVFLVLFFLFRLPIVNIRASIRYPQLRTKWQFWLCSFINLCLTVSVLVFCMGLTEKTPDMVMREFVPYAIGYIFAQLTVYTVLNEMIKNCENQ